jgi:TonB family protein
LPFGGRPRMGMALAISAVAHLTLFLIANQLPSVRYRIVPRLEVIQVRLLYPEPVPKPKRQPKPAVVESPAEHLQGWAEPARPMELEPTLPEPELVAELPTPSLDLPEPHGSGASRELADEHFPLAGALDKREVPTRSAAPELSDELPGREVLRSGADVPGRAGDAWDELLAAPPEHVAEAPRRGPDLTHLPVDTSVVVEPDVMARAVPSRKVMGKLSSPAPPLEKPPTGASRRRIRTVEPEVPAWVEERGIETSTALRIEILEGGRIGNAWLTRSSGYRELDNLAAAAVREWLYEPGLREQRAVLIHYRLR